MSRAFRRTPVALACAAALVAACSKGDSAGNGAAVPDSKAAAASGTATPTPTPAAPAMSDGNILAMLDQANIADSTTGAIAAARGMNPDLKAYGRDMMRDHHALRAGGQALATKANISPVMPAGDVTSAHDAAVADSMSITAMPRGAAFDRFYIDHAVMHHQQVLATAQVAVGATQNAELKAMIEKAAPIVQQHLDRAKQLQAKLP
ncbi:MAG: DUF4142 domain-containing protein [Gemmatimonadaceae bacterium]|nr:DUF4142 domain-containing protein [Gemmatimonadaceae bacterium]